MTLALERAWQAGREAWPTVAVSLADFTAYVTPRCTTGKVEDLRTTDLYLACACAQALGPAIAAFEATYFREIEPAVVRITRSSALVDEVAQALRSHLFMPRPEAPPAITLYGGVGDLRNWTRSALTRLVLNMVSRGPRDAKGSDDLIESIPATESDPELMHLKDVYRAEFREAFAIAVAALDARDRNLLRHTYVDQLNVDEVGALFGVHRATAARWIAAARTQLFNGVRKALMQRLDVDGAEVASIMRLIRSQLDITLARHLKEPEKP